MSRKLYKWPRPMLLIANGLIWSFPGIKILLGGIDAVRECGLGAALSEAALTYIIKGICRLIR